MSPKCLTFVRLVSLGDAHLRDSILAWGEGSYGVVNRFLLFLAFSTFTFENEQNQGNFSSVSGNCVWYH